MAEAYRIKHLALVNRIRTEADNYATTKSITQIIMNGGTIAINVTLFKQIHNRDVPFGDALIGLIWASVAMNIFVIILSSILAAQVPQEAHDDASKRTEEESGEDMPTMDELFAYFKAQLRLLDKLIISGDLDSEGHVLAVKPGLDDPEAKQVSEPPKTTVVAIRASRNQIQPATQALYQIEILDPSILKLKLHQLREACGISGERYRDCCCTVLGCWSPLIPTTGCRTILPFSLLCFWGTTCNLPNEDETPLVRQVRGLKNGSSKRELLAFKRSLTRYLGLHRYSSSSGYLLFTGTQVFMNNIVVLSSVAVIIINIVIASLAPISC